MCPLCIIVAVTRYIPTGGALGELASASIVSPCRQLRETQEGVQKLGARRKPAVVPRLDLGTPRGVPQSGAGANQRSGMQELAASGFGSPVREHSSQGSKGPAMSPAQQRAKYPAPFAGGAGKARCGGACTVARDV